MLQRLKNLWAWSAIKPTPAGFKWNGWVEPTPQEAEKIMQKKSATIVDMKEDTDFNETT